MEWFKKPIDTAVSALIILLSILISCIWMNGRFNEIDENFKIIISSLERIKTSLIIIKHNTG